METDVYGEQIERWRAGEYDVLQVGDWEVLDLAEGEVQVVPSLGTMMFAMRPRGPLAEPGVRRAIARALAGRNTEVPQRDRPAGDGGLLPPSMPGHRHRIWPEPADPAEMLAAAGHPGGAGLGPLRLVTRERLGDLGEDIAVLLRDLGLTVEVESLEDGCDIDGGDLWLSSWVADYPDPDGFFRGLLGLEGFQVEPNDQIRALLGEARACRDRDKRLELYGRIDQLLVTDHAVLVPVAYKRLALLRRPWVSGLWATPLMPACLSHAVVDHRLVSEAAARSAAGTALD
jgi:ABC-type transport system substrate-binding protein